MGAARGCARALRLCPGAEWTGRAGVYFSSGAVLFTDGCAGLNPRAERSKPPWGWILACRASLF